MDHVVEKLSTMLLAHMSLKLGDSSTLFLLQLHPSAIPPSLYIYTPQPADVVFNSCFSGEKEPRP